MKQQREILDYLDEYYCQVIRRPSLYAVSPSALEGMIAFVERLRAFILEDSSQAGRYDEFIRSLGYGARGCSHCDGRDDAISDDDQRLFERVSEVLRQFLEKEGRPTSPAAARWPRSTE
jgi:hypothetical protein